MKKIDVQKLVRDNIKKMKPYSSARDEFQDSNNSLVFLDANENPFENGINRYPDPQQNDLKKVLSKLKNIQKNQILLGNGSDEVLDLLFRAFCEPHCDNVITMPPTYGMYSVLANLNAIKNKEVELSQSFEIQTNDVLKSIDNFTKLIFICSPNNPTGNSFNTANIEEIIQNFNGIVVIDEAYIDFSAHESWLTKIETFPNLVIVQTLSKAHAMAGIRIGIIYASVEIIAVLNKIKPPYNINTLSQNAAIKHLENQITTKKQIEILKEQKKLLINTLSKKHFVKKINDSDANFILLKVDDANQRYSQILADGFVVRNRTNDLLCNNCIRISIGTETENKKLIKILNQYN